MPTVRDKLWLWAHLAGSHDEIYELPRPSRITPVDAAKYMGIRNLIMVQFDGKPLPPFDAMAEEFRVLDRVIWSIIGAGGKTNPEMRAHVFDLAARYENITGVITDDFFLIEDDQLKPCLTIEQLQEMRDRLHVGDKQLEMWTVLYDYMVDQAPTEHLALADRLTFWTWETQNLANLEANFAKCEQRIPSVPKVLGCYMWDYGTKQPTPVGAMQKQCDLGLQWLRDGRIDGIILLASCVCDIELEAVEWTRKWIERVADEPL